jgi:hypothetical protein
MEPEFRFLQLAVAEDEARTLREQVVDREAEDQTATTDITELQAKEMLAEIQPAQLAVVAAEKQTLVLVRELAVTVLHG